MISRRNYRSSLIPGAICLPIIAVAGLLLFSPLIFAQTASDIFRRAIQSHGGRQAFLLNRDLVWEAPVEFGSARGQLVQYFKWPDKLRRELSVQQSVEEQLITLEIVQIYDGRTAWARRGAEFREDVGLAKEMSRAARCLFILLRHQNEGVQIRHLREKVASGSVDVVEMIEKWGNTILYFDRESGLLNSMTFSDGIAVAEKERETRLSFADFLSVGGLLMPHRIEQHNNGKKVGEIRYSRINRAEGLEDSLFAPRFRHIQTNAELAKNPS